MDHQPITATQSDDQPKVYFADLRHEVELAARRHAELSSALDIYADELSHIAFAVTGDRDAIIGFHQIVDHVKAVVAERDELRAELDTANAELEDAHRFERDARQVEAERDRLRAVVERIVTEWERIGGDADVVEIYTLLAEMHRIVADAHAALDVSPAMGGEE